MGALGCANIVKESLYDVPPIPEVTLIAIALAAVPPHEAASTAMFEAKVVGGSVFFALLGWALFKRYQAIRLRDPGVSGLPVSR